MPDGSGAEKASGARSSEVAFPGKVALFLIAWLLLLWPLVLNGAPFYSDDSGSYLRGGEFGFRTGLLIIDQWLQPTAAAGGHSTSGDPKVIVAHAIADAGGARSLIYSVLTHLLRWPGMTLLSLAIAQAGTIAFILTLLRSQIAPGIGLGPSLVAAAAVAVLTPAAWYAAYVVPDILAGVGIAGAVILTVFFERLNVALRAVLVILIAGCITVHGSHLPIVFATLVSGGVANFLLQRPASVAAAVRRATWFLSPVLLAISALLGTSYVAFGELSLFPKRYPIQLARSVADGPGAWHLRDHCATERYAICEIFGTNPPRDVGDFLWGKDGVRYAASPEQMERIRAEESVIVRRAALEYPAHQARKFVSNTLLQLLQFGPDSLSFGYVLAGRNDPQMVQVAPDWPVLKRIGRVLIYLGFAVAIAALFVLRRRLRRAEVAAVSVAIIGLLANAAVCGGLSAVTDRYQGRVAWVLPALVFFIVLRVWTERRPAITSA